MSTSDPFIRTSIFCFLVSNAADSTGAVTAEGRYVCSVLAEFVYKVPGTSKCLSISKCRCSCAKSLDAPKYMHGDAFDYSKPRFTPCGNNMNAKLVD